MKMPETSFSRTSFKMANNSWNATLANFYWIVTREGHSSSIFRLFLFHRLRITIIIFDYSVSVPKITPTRRNVDDFSIYLLFLLSRRRIGKDALVVCPNNYGYGIRVMIKLITSYLRQETKRKIPAMILERWLMIKTEMSFAFFQLGTN